MHEEFSLKVWSNKRRRRVESYNRWKFRGPEKGNVDGLLLAVTDNKVIGQLGLIPVKLKIGEKRYDAQWACDLMVDPDFRKKGFGRLLFDEGLKRDAVTLGNNPSPAAEAVMTKKGFRKIESAKIMIFPINVEHLMNWALKGRLKFAIPMLGKFVQPYFSSKAKRIRRSKSNFRKCNWEELSELMAINQNQNPDPQIVHDENFLKWRAGGMERFSPEFSAIRSDSGSYALYSSFPPYLNIYDWHCSSKEETAEMISFIFHKADEFKSELIQLMTNESKEEEWLLNLGFVRARNPENIIHYSKDNVLDKAQRFYFTLCDADINL